MVQQAAKSCCFDLIFDRLSPLLLDIRPLHDPPMNRPRILERSTGTQRSGDLE